MRAVATAAGLSPGNAYYYFPSKQHLVQHFYADIQAEHRRRSAAVLAGSTSLEPTADRRPARRIDAMAPYHEFAASFITRGDRSWLAAQSVQRRVGRRAGR